MADNTTLDLGTGGDPIRTIDRSGTGPKTPVTVIDVGAGATESLVGESGVGLPIKGLGTAGTANSGVVTIQGIASMTAVAVSIASLPALAAGTNNIGDVDVLTLPAITGTVTANAGTNLNTSALALETTASAIKTGVELIDDSVATLGTTTYTEATTKGLIVGGVRRDADTTLVGTTNEIAPFIFDARGFLKVEVFDGGESHTVDGTVAISTLPALVAGTANIGDVDIASIAAGDNNIGNVDIVSLPALPAGTNNIGDVDVLTLPALPAGTNNIGDVDVLTLPALPAGTNNIGSVHQAPGTTDGLTLSKTVSAASTNATSVKASAGKVYHIYASNVNAAARYLKLYNKASAPTVGTDTPVLTYLIPGNTAGAGFTINVPTGLAFATGIAFALTTGAADADTGAVAASELVVNLGYK